MFFSEDCREHHMQQDQPIEQRVFILEQEMAEVKAKVDEQGNVNIALLRRIDAFISDLHRIERDQRAGFNALRGEITGQRGEIDALKAEVQANQRDTVNSFKQISEILHDHKEAIDILVVGQQQTKEAIDLLVAAQQQTSETLRDHKAAIDLLAAGQQQTNETLREHKEAIDLLAAGQQQTNETLREHKEVIDLLAAGQRQIVELLMGQRRCND